MTKTVHENGAEELVALLAKRKQKIAFAESCTGGEAASAVISVPGASDVIGLSLITYSDKVKHQVLGVKKKTLKDKGAVSKKCAKEMASGCRKATGADLAVSITGFAGPDGGTKKAPVGTVFVGCKYKDKVTVKEFHFGGDRQTIRSQATTAAISVALDALLDRKNG